MRAFILETRKKDGTSKKHYVSPSESVAVEMEGHFSEVETLDVSSPTEIEVDGSLMTALSDVANVLSMNESTYEDSVKEGEIKYL